MDCRVLQKTLWRVGEDGEQSEGLTRTCLDESGFSKTSESRAQTHFWTSPRDLRTKTPSWATIKSLTEGSTGGAPIEVQGIQQVKTDLLDIVLLYRTLVAGGGLPPGLEVEFSTLGPILESAAQRQGRRIRELSNMDAAVLLQQQKAQQRRKPKVQRLRLTSSYVQRSCRRADTSPADSVHFTRDRRPGRTQKRKKDHAGWKYWVLCHARSHSDAYGKDSRGTTR